jgi:hypothetical protein
MSPFRSSPVPRVPRSRRDDRYEAGRPTPYKRPSAGWVKSVQADDGTCTVVILDESITGVIPLDDMPTPGAIVEIEARGDLLVILNWYEYSFPAVESMFGPVGTHEGKPENGNAVFLVGDPSSLWSDDDLSTYSDQFGGGFEDPWGHPAAQMLTLPMSKEDAAQVLHVKLTWTVRVVSWDPSNDPYDEHRVAMSAMIRLGKGTEGYAGYNYHTLAPAVWWADDYSESLYNHWSDIEMTELGKWYTFSDYLVPIYTDRSVQQLLSLDFEDSTYYWTPARMAAGGTIDVDHLYLITYQEEFWSEEHFQVGEVVVEFIRRDDPVPPSPPPAPAQLPAGMPRPPRPEEPPVDGNTSRGEPYPAPAESRTLDEGE